MDRRHIPEAAEIADAGQLRKAVALVLQSYQGLPAPRLYAEAVVCFEGLLQIANNSESIRNFAAAEKHDLKYLVDGANYVISLLHFNPENNYYTTLGLPQSATTEMIRERWKTLMLLYHPDRRPENTEWVSERAKKVNEASSVLRDGHKREEYDRLLTERALFENGEEPPARGRTAPPEGRAARRPVRVGSQSNRAFSKFAKHFPKIIILASIAAALAFLAAQYLQNESMSLEKELLSEGSTGGGSAGKRGERKLDLPAESVQVRTQEQTPAETGRPVSLPSYNKAAAAASSSRQERAADHEAGVVSVPPQPPQKQEQIPPVLPAPPAAVSAVKPELLTRAEVEEFLKRYKAAYEGGDLRVFLSLFSDGAVENNGRDLSAIKTAYQDTFSEKIGFYRLSGIDIALDGRTATVSGLYALSRYSGSQGWLKYSGRIHWTLKKEDEAVKIVRIHYDR